MTNFSNEYNSSDRGSLAFEELFALIRYRGLVIQLVKRDLISRYKRSVLGVAWTLLNPLGTMLILTLVFSALFNSVQGYPIYLLSGLIAWNFFAQTSSATLNQNIWGSSLLHRIYLPRTAFSISTLGTGLVNFVLTIFLLIFIIVVIGFHFHITILFVPVAILLLSMFTLGFSLLFSTLAIYFPDVVDMFQVVLSAWMYLTPIFYPEEIIPMPLRTWLLGLNPMYYFIQLFRLPVYDGVIPSSQLILISFGIALITLLIGWSVFTSKSNELTYRT
ncbi:ABC transporter permease [Chloroflexota bacterium]